MKIIPNGEGKAKLLRNKRGGIKLRVKVDPLYTGSFCYRCQVNIYNDRCVASCKDFEEVVGTKYFWFEKER